MLVLSRHVEEEIVLTDRDGTQTIVKIVAINGDRVRVGIQAPLSVTIHRREVQDKVDEQG